MTSSAELNLVNTEIGLRQNSTSTAVAAYTQSDAGLYVDSRVSKAYVYSGSKLLFQPP